MVAFIRRVIRWLSRLQLKMAFTYTVVTVGTLLVMEIALLGLLFVTQQVLRVDDQTIASVSYHGLNRRIEDLLAKELLEPAVLQEWMEERFSDPVLVVGERSWLGSADTLLAPGRPILFVDPQLRVLAQIPAGFGPLGEPLDVARVPDLDLVLPYALANGDSPSLMYASRGDGTLLMALPIAASDEPDELLGVIILTAQRPAIIASFRAAVGSFIAVILVTGLLLTAGAVPLGLLFGYVMSRGLVRRLGDLAQVAEAYSQGRFDVSPRYRSQDEIGLLGRRLKRMGEQLQNLLGSRQQLAALEERNRLARELHDTVKQQNFATLMQVRAARNLMQSDSEQADNYLELAEDLIKQSQQELQALIAEYRPAALDGKGLAEALQTLVADWERQTQIKVELRVLGERAIPLDLEQALYRVAQEALANVVRHSQATAVSIALQLTAQEVSLVIGDNGRGFVRDGELRQGFGLHTMHDRLAEFGGTLDVASRPGRGTSVRARVPL